AGAGTFGLFYHKPGSCSCGCVVRPYNGFTPAMCGLPGCIDNAFPNPSACYGGCFDGCYDGCCLGGSCFDGGCKKRHGGLFRHRCKRGGFGHAWKGGNCFGGGCL